MVENPKPVSPAVRRFVMAVDRLVIVLSKHWLLFVNSLLLLFVGLPALAPVLMHYGFSGPAELIYTAYRLTCHELAYRSFFFFGQQPSYDLAQLSQSFGVPGYDLTYWSAFQGDAQLGYKMAFCERDAAIYGSMLIAGIVFGLVRSRLPRLHWRIYLLLLAPMAVDGFWQLFTSPVDILPFLPTHESTWWLRSLTGVLFGAGSVWLIYPYVQEAMRDLYLQSTAQWQRAVAHAAPTSHKP